MQPIKVNVPRNLGSDDIGFSFFMQVSLELYKTEDSTVLFDFSDNQYFEINLCCPLGVLIENLRSRNNSVQVIGLNEVAEHALQKNGFYSIYDPEFKKSAFQDSIEYRTFKLDDTMAFQEYINNQLLDHADFPKMSRALRKKILESITEIFNNAHNHGQCDNFHTCGHFFRHTNLLKFTMTDLGITIRRKVNEFFKTGRTMTGVDTIRWAVKPGNTTNQGTIPGGLGYHLIRQFLRHNGGQIQIISSDGFWQEDHGKVIVKSFPHRFLGTIVNLGFNLADTNSYILQEEVDLENIF